MKNYASLFTALLSVFSFGCFAQPSISSNGENVNAQLLASNIENSDLIAVSYHVEERINMDFGSRITTYDVPDLSLVSTKDLGPNNSRRITPKFAKAKLKTESFSIADITALNLEQPKAIVNILSTVVIPAKVEKVVDSKPKYVNIDLLDTYERVLDKGYKSVDMLKKVANNRFFHDDLVIAAKWYTRLFSMTTDLEPVMYYRYAQSLKAVGENAKSKEMMAIFESKDKASNAKP